MKRRTNLFYSDPNSPDSTFLTFSNYTEHLTGVFLATNFKLFPSRFLCMYIPSLEEEKWSKDENLNPRSGKQAFIEDYLCGYYENKLALLRDAIVKNADNSTIDKQYCDSILLYLGYLIEAIMKFDDKSELVLASTITEQDYNGTFTDIICTIDSANSFDKNYAILDGERNSGEFYETTEIQDLNYLYGWSNLTADGSFGFDGPQHYASIRPQFDGTDSVKGGKFYYISCKKKIVSGIQKRDSIKFNVVIPLYDIVNCDPLTNTTEIVEDLKDIEIRVPEGDSHAFNVPYGIWFANETITLRRDNQVNYAPSWSLLIATQFKPFPSSQWLNQYEESNSKMAGFQTFAEILYNQTHVYNQMMENSKALNSLNNDVDAKIAYITTIYNEFNNLAKLDELRELVERLENTLKDSSNNMGVSTNAQYYWQRQQ